jgi:PHP family Zn ribbon phosphoesterase
LGREVTLINGKISFKSLSNALQNQDIIGSIEFFPEEGKYHLSGHRICKVVRGPDQIKQNGEVCPVCKKKMTIGVMQRVEELAKRSEKELELYKDNGILKSKKFPNKPGFRMLVQLEEILAESLGVAVKTTKVKTVYEKLVTELDSELKILTKVQIPLIAMAAGDRVAEGVRRVRGGHLSIEPGFDNTYGKVTIFDEVVDKNLSQEGLF